MEREAGNDDAIPNVVEVIRRINEWVYTTIPLQVR